MYFFLGGGGSKVKIPILFILTRKNWKNMKEKREFLCKTRIELN